MVPGESSEAAHFYIDTSPPESIRAVLHAMVPGRSVALGDLAETLRLDHGVMSKPRTEWLRRLYDLGLADQKRIRSSALYELTPLGMKIRELDQIDPDLYPDLMHYLHFTSYDGSSQARGYLWSYRFCCQAAWDQGILRSSKEIAAAVQTAMKEQFPDLDFLAKRGARFDDTAASRWLRWVRTLEPCPFPPGQDRLHKRSLMRYELSLLALDDLYRTRGYRYGDPVLLDDAALDDLAAVFFLDLTCCRELIDVAARLTKVVKLSDTFAGTSIALLEPYGVERI